MATVIKTVFQFRRGTTAEWIANKDVKPAPGEPCFDTELNTLRIGNGNDTYEHLVPIGGVHLDVSADNKSIKLEDKVFKLMGFDAAEVGAYVVKGEDGNLAWVVPEVTVNDLAAEIGAPADAEAGTEATGIYAELEAKADAADVDAINDKIGDVAEGKTIVEMITDAAYDDTALADKVTAVEEKAHEHANKDVLDGVTVKKITAWDAAEENAVNRVLGYLASEEVNANYDTLKEVAAWIESDTTASAALVTRVSDLEKVGAEKNVIATVDTAQFNVDENRHLTLLDIAISKVAGLQDALDAKVDTEEGSRLITADEISKLSKLVIDEETGDVGLSGSISADNVVGLQDKLDTKVDAEEGKSLVSDTLITKLEAIDAAAQENKIENVKVGDTPLAIIEKAVTIPVGAGLKASEEITIAEDGTLGVGVISWSKIAQVEGETVTFDGGTAAG